MTLIINKPKGYATELDAKEVNYDPDYFNILKGYEDTEIDKKLMKCRVDMVKDYCGRKGEVFDFGCGTGQFLRKIRSYFSMVYGWDRMILSRKWLRDNFMLLDPYNRYNQDVPMKKLTGMCFWDSLEHLKNPSVILNLIPDGCYVFISIPIFNDLDDIKQSRHYRPGEHYWYFTHKGLVKYMEALHYTFLGVNDCEIRAGREDIYSYVFKESSNAVRDFFKPIDLTKCKAIHIPLKETKQ